MAPEVPALTFAAAPHRVALTTDAIAPCGTGPTGPAPPLVLPCGAWWCATAARLADGTLAGSVATPSDMLRARCRRRRFPERRPGAPRSPGRSSGAAALPCSRVIRPTVVLDDAMEVCQAWRHGRRLV
ncbi:MAG: hypothetical protein R2789_02945 [Microthrixaceae bacterium]